MDRRRRTGGYRDIGRRKEELEEKGKRGSTDTLTGFRDTEVPQQNGVPQGWYLCIKGMDYVRTYSL